jgi:hypothetical protein
LKMAKEIDAVKTIAIAMSPNAVNVFIFSVHPLGFFRIEMNKRVFVKVS